MYIYLRELVPPLFDVFFNRQVENVDGNVTDEIGTERMRMRMREKETQRERER